MTSGTHDKRSAAPEAGFDAVFAPFHDGLREGRLRVQWCATCRRHQWPARSVCTGCHGTGIEWADVDEPIGSVFSWTVVHHAKGTPFAADAPYAVALVELEREQVRMFAHVPEPQTLSIGARATIDFHAPTASGHPSWRVLHDPASG
ncbi:MAG TPA: hypothetical protein GX718_11145 [Brevibacterium sp.]|nr:hypothetical protein [Brevibacterium sp.]